MSDTFPYDKIVEPSLPHTFMSGGSMNVIVFRAVCNRRRELNYIRLIAALVSKKAEHESVSSTQDTVSSSNYPDVLIRNGEKEGF